MKIIKNGIFIALMSVLFLGSCSKYVEDLIYLDLHIKTGESPINYVMTSRDKNLSKWIQQKDLSKIRVYVDDQIIAVLRKQFLPPYEVSGTIVYRESLLQISELYSQ
jgi:hypothetical protein